VQSIAAFSGELAAGILQPAAAGRNAKRLSAGIFLTESDPVPNDG
jgi:hypothetical protein